MDIYQDQIHTFIGSSLLFLAISWIAFRLGFFKKITDIKKTMITLTWWDVIGVFSSFLTMMVVVVPVLFYIYLSYSEGHLVTPEELKDLRSMESSFNLAAILLSTVIVILYIWMLPSNKRRDVIGQRGWKFSDLTIGMSTWFLCFPLVVASSQLAQIFLKKIGKMEAIQDQVAVEQFKLVKDKPYLMLIFAFLLIVLVPFIEEVLFRGFLQNRLKKSFGVKVAIILTSMIFALFHFSASQSWGNLELMISLFLLACFLGYLYERQQSIWAPVVLHGTFNAISVIAILAS